MLNTFIGHDIKSLAELKDDMNAIVALFDLEVDMFKKKISDGVPGIHSYMLDGGDRLTRHAAYRVCADRVLNWIKNGEKHNETEWIKLIKLAALQEVALTFPFEADRRTFDYKHYEREFYGMLVGRLMRVEVDKKYREQSAKIEKEEVDEVGAN